MADKAIAQKKQWWKYIVFFWDWSIFEKILLGINFALSIFFLAFYYKNDWLTWLDFFANITNIVCVILVAKKKISNYIWGFVAVALLGIVAFLHKNTGTWMLNWIFYVPCQFIGFIMWRRKSENKVDVKSKKMNIWQIIILSLVAAGLIALFGWTFSLKNFQLFWYEKESSYPLYYYVIDGSVLVLSIVAMILMLLRYREQWIIWIVVDVVCVILWCLTLDWTMILSWSTALVNAIYGVIKWRKQE